MNCKNFFFGGMAALLIVAPLHAEDQYKEIINEMISGMTELSSQLKTVTDTVSADKAAPEIVKIVVRMEGAAQRALKIGEPSDKAQAEALKKEYEPKLMPVVLDISTQLMRINQEKITTPEFEKAMASLHKLGSLGKSAKSPEDKEQKPEKAESQDSQ